MRACPRGLRGTWKRRRRPAASVARAVLDEVEQVEDGGIRLLAVDADGPATERGGE